VFAENETPWMPVAFGEIGVKEIPGAGSNKKIEEYLKVSAQFEGRDDVAWCAAFVGWCLKKVGYKGTNSLYARSYMKLARIKSPCYGAVVVFKRGTEPWMGHVGFVTKWNPLWITCLGGNQNNMVSEQRYPRWKVLGFYWPEKQGV
jgi:uncharacterized protein (TIGR02594 family)